MRAQHTAHPFPAFPVYSSAFVADDKFIAGGGGGASRTGIKNKLRLFRVSDDRQLDVLSELELDKDEDVPMSMAAHPQSGTFVCGINSSAAMLEKCQNENCRKFSVSTDEHRLTQLATCGTLTSGDLEDYQRVTVLSADGRFLLVAGARDLSLLDYDSLSPVATPVHVSSGEIYDGTFSISNLFLTTGSKLLVYALPTSANDVPQSPSTKKSRFSGSDKSMRELREVKAVELPPIHGLPSGSNITFRAARLHPIHQDTLYTAVNVTLPRARNAKMAKKQAYVLKWKITQEDDTLDVSVDTMRKVYEGNFTCFDVSSNGKFLAFGASDYSLCVLDSATLAPLLSILKAHEFPITTIRFNPTSKLLVSGGVDSSLRVINVPENLGSQSWGSIILVIVTILVLIIAVIMMQK